MLGINVSCNLISKIIFVWQNPFNWGKTENTRITTTIHFHTLQYSFNYTAHHMTVLIIRFYGIIKLSRNKFPTNQHRN